SARGSAPPSTPGLRLAAPRRRLRPASQQRDAIHSPSSFPRTWESGASEVAIRLDPGIRGVTTESIAVTVKSERLHRLQDLGDMARHLDLVPDVAHNAVLVDQKGAAVDPHVFAAIHAFFDPDPITLGHLAGRVGSQGKRQLVLLFEFVVRGDRIAGDPD